MLKYEVDSKQVEKLKTYLSHGLLVDFMHKLKKLNILKKDFEFVEEVPKEDTKKEETIEQGKEESQYKESMIKSEE